MGETYVKEEINKMAEANEQELNSSHEATKDRLDGMRKKTDLSDIILEKENSTHSKQKKLIISAASLILLFLVSLIISKMFNSTPAGEDNTTKEPIADTQIEQKSENKPVVAIKDLSKKEETSTNKDNLSDTDAKFEEMVKKLREEEAKENGNADVVKVIKPKEEEKKQEEKTLVAIDEKPTKKEPASKNKTPKVIITDATKPVVTKETKVKPVKQVSKPTKAYPSQTFSGSKRGYYIQVGATTNPTPNRYLVSKIKRNGFNYITHPIYVKGRKFYKILIGPYKTRNAAGADMDRVKATINPKAFFYHIR